MKKLTIPQIEKMYQNGALSEFEYLDLIERYIRSRKKEIAEGK